MSDRIVWIVAIVDLIAIIYIANLVRIKRLELKYALIWFLVGILLLIFDLSPNLLYNLTRALGISLPINMLFFLGFGFVLMIIFTQTIVISNLTRKAKRLTQEVGLLNKRIDNLVERIHIDEAKQGDLKENIKEISEEEN
ncbi:MAG: DUF2304 domain-containing protein [Lachnospiraceae bacterium]|nr:DUF2304 domain-containing protein [Lachnospiraceae bacterium]